MSEQLFWLFIVSLPVACVCWTITHEEIFREPREKLSHWSNSCHTWWQRKFCYMFTCEYCLSHYVAAIFVALTGYQLLLADWRGYVLAWLAVVAVANVYMSGYNRLRVEIRRERTEANVAEKKEAAIEDTHLRIETGTIPGNGTATSIRRVAHSLN